MSTEWGYFCKDCQEESETWFNHGEDKLEQYFIVRELLKGEDMHWIEISPLNGRWAVGEMDEFLEKHEGHSLCLINEYGRKQEFSHHNKNALEGNNQCQKSSG